MKHVKKLLPFLKPYWKLATISLILLTAVLVIDLAIPRLIQRIVDQGVNAGDMQVVLQTSGLMIGLSLLQFLLALGNNLFSIQAGEGVARDLREALFVKIQAFSYGNIDRFTTGRLMVRMSSDTAAVQRIFQVSLRIGTRAPLLMIGSLILMFSTNRGLALSMLPLLLVTSVIIVFFSIKMEPLFLSVQQKLDQLNTVLQENIAGARLVKAFARAEHENQRFAAVNEDFTERHVKVMTFMSTMSPVLTFFVNIGIVLVVYTGGLRVIQGDMTDGQIIAFINYLTTTMNPLIMMTMLANTWANGIASARRVNEVLDTPAEVQDLPGAVRLPEAIQGSVRFKHVSFHYNGSSQNTVLENINLTAEPGQTVAILGATGSGKSSLIHLIPRFYDPTRGQRGDRRGGHPHGGAGFAAGAGGHRAAGDGAVLRQRARQHPLRQAGGERRRGGGGGQSGPGARLHPGAAAGLRHARRRARREPVGRAEAAHRHRPGDHSQAQDPDPG